MIENNQNRQQSDRHQTQKIQQIINKNYFSERPQPGATRNLKTQSQVILQNYTDRTEQNSPSNLINLQLPSTKLSQRKLSQRTQNPSNLGSGRLPLPSHAHGSELRQFVSQIGIRGSGNETSMTTRPLPFTLKAQIAQSTQLVSAMKKPPLQKVCRSSFPMENTHIPSCLSPALQQTRPHRASQHLQEFIMKEQQRSALQSSQVESITIKIKLFPQIKSQQNFNDFDNVQKKTFDTHSSMHQTETSRPSMQSLNREKLKQKLYGNIHSQQSFIRKQSQQSINIHNQFLQSPVLSLNHQPSKQMNFLQTLMHKTKKDYGTPKQVVLSKNLTRRDKNEIMQVSNFQDLEHKLKTGKQPMVLQYNPFN